MRNNESHWSGLMTCNQHAANCDHWSTLKNTTTKRPSSVTAKNRKLYYVVNIDIITIIILHSDFSPTPVNCASAHMRIQW